MAASPSGFDPAFLPVPVPLPTIPPGLRIRELPYTHFTIQFAPVRRLAAATAVNLDGSALRDLPRPDDWHFDPRVPEADQIGPGVYARNDLDRGHLVRRRDPVWGEDAARANEDTFVFTNAAPQAGVFNQGEDLWGGVEDHVLTYAAVNRLRLNVFTGPVSSDDDPPYRGVRIPRLFWKIAAWVTSGGTELAAAAFVLDQTPELDDLELGDRTRAALAQDDPPPLGPFRTFQVPVAHVAELSGLGLDVLVRADVLQPVPTLRAGGRESWLPLRTLQDAHLERV